MRSGSIVVVGDVMIDVIVKAEGPMRPGTDRPATIRSLPGGSGANQAAWIAALGGEAELVARVARDDHEEQTAALRRSGVKPVLAADDTTPTGRLVALLSPDGERSFFTDRGANENLSAEDLPTALLDRAALIHVSGYSLIRPEPRAALFAFAEQARRRGIPISLDPGSSGFIEDVGVEAFWEWSRFASICFPNEDEAAILAETSDESLQRERLSRRYGLAVIKRGRRGAEAASADGRCWFSPAPDVAVVDTSGAGDAFAAAYLISRLKGDEPAQSLEKAVRAGSLATTRLGGRPDPTASWEERASTAVDSSQSRSSKAPSR